MAGRPETDEPEELIGIEELAKFLEDETDDEAHDTGPVPVITRMPEGIEVVERHIGHAVGHWVLQVRCECGRRWFEVEPVKTGKCPRCGSVVMIEIERD